MKFKLLKAADYEQNANLIQALNSALADEYLAAYQYLAPIGLAVGKERANVEAEFDKHYHEELEHASKMKQRIIQLGGTPLLSPEEWFSNTSCGYTRPNDFNTGVLVQQNLEAEMKAIDVYNNLVALCQELNDQITLDIVKEILADEEEHKQDLTDFKADMELI